MHVLAVTPIVVSEEELERRRRRYAQLAPDGVQVTLENITPDAPRALETEVDVRASEDAVAAWFRAADTDGVDAFLPDCVLDPAVEEDLPRPLIAIGRLAAHFAAGTGGVVGAVARNRAIADELDRRLAAYGLAAKPTAVIDLSVEDIADDRIWNEAVGRAVAGLGADLVINGCSAVDVHASTGGAIVIDPTATALRMVDILARPSP